ASKRRQAEVLTVNMQSSISRKPIRRGVQSLAALGSALGLLASVPAAAQEAPVMIDASVCLKFETSVERLVCFEEQAKAAAGNTSSTQGSLPVLRIERSNAQTPAPAAQPAAPAATARVETPAQAPAQAPAQESRVVEAPAD